MKPITEQEYLAQLAKIQTRNEAYERSKKLKEEKRKFGPHIQFPTTSKLMAAYLFIILNVILIYAMAAMWYFADLSYLGVLITDIGGQVMTYFIYARKATKENTAGGITYDLAMADKGSGITTGEINEDAAG